ncbi:DUF6988 family protein [Ideonella sp.]|uniref:DUF6988 family protein n=1 Tax=Ideonella sp. TaxID=1929293 RepID=UPI0037C08271
MSVPCLAVAQDHFKAILVLLSQSRPLCAPAYALARPMLEAAIRGQWLAFSATADQIEKLLNDTLKFPSFNSMLSALEWSGLAGIAVTQSHYKTFCAYTHTGAQLISRMSTGQRIEQRFRPEEIAELIDHCEVTLLLAGAAIANIAGNAACLEEIATLVPSNSLPQELKAYS